VLKKGTRLGNIEPADVVGPALPQAKLKVYNVFLRRSYNCVSYKGLNFLGFLAYNLTTV